MKTVIILLFLTSFLYPKNPESQIELNGIFLSQYRSIMINQFGQPLKRTVTGDGWIYEFYKVKPDTSVYMLIKSPPDDTLSILFLQINGYKFDEMHPFLGLKLGDSISKVFSILGSPSEIKEAEGPKVKVYYFENRNYSVEIDEDNKLYGIEIFGFDGFADSLKDQPDFPLFKNKILGKDKEWLLYHIMPDFEIYKDYETYSYEKAARENIFDNFSKIDELLFSGSESVWGAMNEDDVEYEVDVRLTESNKVYFVWKFPKSKMLKEIVLSVQANTYKIYEIAFN
jgi:hypothetical protein